jgi:hypothetical protein
MRDSLGRICDKPESPASRLLHVRQAAIRSEMFPAASSQLASQLAFLRDRLGRICDNPESPASRLLHVNQAAKGLEESTK